MNVLDEIGKALYYAEHDTAKEGSWEEYKYKEFYREQVKTVLAYIGLTPRMAEEMVNKQKPQRVTK